MTVTGSYSLQFVALSVLLAMFASYSALDLTGRVTSARGNLRIVWLGFGASAMGLGIWAMHYVGMLALTLPMPVFYHVPTVLLSLFAAIAASVVALYVVSQPEMGTWSLALGSVAMGSAIAAMHYIGMAAMRCQSTVSYNDQIVALSIAIGIGVSFVALKLAFRVRNESHTTQRKLVSALVMGSAIPLMHYTGMWAASFHPSTAALDLTNTVSISTIGAMAIILSSIFVMTGAIAISSFDRYTATHRDDLHAAREREMYFRTMAEALPEIIWTAEPDGQDDYFNQRTLDYTGLGSAELKGDGWKVIVHPDDVDNCFGLWQNALRVGEPYEVEYRLRAGDGSYRWFLGRANPVRDGTGKIVKWFGTASDIENQKHNQQILQEQILERTMQLADVNTRLQEEMIEKDFARNELDQQNEKMVSELHKRSERATLLAKMGELLQSCESREEVFSAALGFAPKIFPAAPGAVALLNSGRTLVEVIGSWTDCRLPVADFEPSACWALRTGHPHLVLAGDNTARCAHAAGIRPTYLCIPILAQGETLGILHFQATEEQPQMETSELSFKTTFAGQVGLSIANIRLREALHTQSVRDALTGLYNRRYLEEVMDREVRRAGRGQQSLSLLMLDLDHFKGFNDTYGHDAGDTVLREAASLLLKNVRAEDFVCRFGGEEFVVILPTADQAGARSRAERLRTKMKETIVMHQGKSLGMVTFSVGVATFPENGTSPKELMAAADAALYEAKRGGRDQVVVSAPKSGDETVAPPDAARASASWG
jgi:diguanylate cyclase (GGDEF)-like protein/PAS domain S-box-containing protein